MTPVKGQNSGKGEPATGVRHAAGEKAKALNPACASRQGEKAKASSPACASRRGRGLTKIAPQAVGRRGDGAY